MTTQRLQRDWRIPTAGLAVVVFLIARFALDKAWYGFIHLLQAADIH
ncbi:hypothetical protein ACVGWU_16925 [Enterobacter intestinihominis]